MDGKKLAKFFREGVPSKEVSALSMRPPNPASTKNNTSHGGGYDKTNQAPPPRPTFEGEIRSTDTKWPEAPKRQKWDDGAAYYELMLSLSPCPPLEHARPDGRKSRAAAAATPAAGAAPKPSAQIAATFKQLGRQRRKEKEDAERRRRREEEDVEKPVVPKEKSKKETDIPADTQLTLDMINSMAPRGMYDVESPKAPVLALKPLEEIQLPPYEVGPHVVHTWKEPLEDVLPCKAMSLASHTDEDEGWEHLASDSGDSEDDTDTVGGWEML